MKKIFKRYIIYFLAFGMATACKKTESNLPDREKSPEVSEIAKNYLDILSGAQEGWVLSYKPDQYSDTVYIHLKFHEQEVNMLSGIRGYHDIYDTTSFGFEGKYSPVIAFSQESIFGKIKDEWNGFHKFKIDYDEDEGVFGLMRSDGYDDKSLKMKKASEDARKPLDAQIDTILALIAYEEEQERLLAEIRQKFNTFVEYESDLYFYNLRTDAFSGAVTSIDTANREISFRYKVTPTAAPVELTTNYSFFTNGIVLSPAITFSGVEIDTIKLGELDYPHIQILQAGNAGAGKMGFMHEAPYEFTLSTGP